MPRLNVFQRAARVLQKETGAPYMVCLQKVRDLRDSYTPGPERFLDFLIRMGRLCIVPEKPPTTTT